MFNGKVLGVYLVGREDDGVDAVRFCRGLGEQSLAVNNRVSDLSHRMVWVAGTFAAPPVPPLP